MHRISRLVALLVVFSFASLVGACGSDAETGVRVVSLDAAYDMLFEDKPEDLVVIDVRTPEEFRANRLPDAVLIDIYEPDFQARIAELDRDVPYLLYCRSGNRSQQARQIMEDLGFRDVADVEGGMVAWLEDGKPFVTG